MSGGGGAPKRNVYQEIKGELRAKRDMMPSILASENQFRPEFSALEMSNLDDILFGGQAGSRTLEYTEPVHGYRHTLTGAFTTEKPTGRTSHSGGISHPRSGGVVDQGQWVPASQDRKRTKTISTPASPGLMAMMRNIDPGTSQMWETLTANANRDLEMGGQMDPATMRQVMQGVRQRQQGTLGGTGSAGEFQEALGLSGMANLLQNQRRSFATGMAAANENRSQSYFDRARQMSGAGPRLFGSTVNINDIFSSNQNAAAAKQASDAATNTALAGAGISAAATLGAAALI